MKAYDINPTVASGFSAQLAELGVKIEVAPSPQEACTGVDISVTCTSSRTPFVIREWLEEGMHIVAVGADMPHRRELKPGVYARADK